MRLECFNVMIYVTVVGNCKMIARCYGTFNDFFSSDIIRGE